MTKLQVQSVYCLNKGNKYKYKYKGIASDGSNIYCSVPERKEIHRFDKELSRCETMYTVRRAYSSICYDERDKCFWALSIDNESDIFCLDCDMREINRIHISLPGHASEHLTGISCAKKQSELIVSTPYFLGKVDKVKSDFTVIRETSSCEHYLCVEMISSDYLFASCKKDQPEITLTSKTGDISLQHILSNKYKPVDFALQSVPQKEKCSCFQLYILVVDSCKCYHVLKCLLMICGKDYRPSECQSRTDLIESVALIEASLAHILNAEGEKLQKVIRISNDVCEIMRVNESVNQSIKNVTELEKVLIEKLRIAVSIP